MIVRLKGRYTARPACSKGRFQFYDSPIKRSTTLIACVIALMFQFYDSPIKRCFFYILTALAHYRFNSMIVRLKVRRDCGDSCFLRSFNSMIVRLKGAFSNEGGAIVDLFQFYDSPIKSAINPTGLYPVGCSFNSMIVRLKARSS